MTQPSNLRIGPAEQLSCGSPPVDDSSAAALLKSAILAHFSGNSESAGDGESGNVLTVDNKYFTALVALEDLNLAGAESVENQQRKEDGVILTFRDDASQAHSAPLDALASVHSAAESSRQAGDLIRLLVAVTLSPTSPKSTKEAEEEYSRRVLWCLDRGYEYVEADLSEDGTKSGHDDRDKDGFARVVEAVGGTVWSGAVNKPRGSTGGARGGAGVSSAAVPPAAADVEVPVANAAANAAAASAKSNDALVLPPEPNLPEDDDEESNEEKRDQYVFDDLEKVMSEAARVRAQAREGQMSDEERRMRASDAAVALMGVLDRMGFDDDSDVAGRGDINVEESDSDDVVGGEHE